MIIKVVDSEGSPTIQQAIKDVITFDDPITGSSSNSPVGKLKDLISQYYMNEKYTFDGNDDSGLLLDELFPEGVLIVPMDTFIKEGWKFEESLDEDDLLTSSFQYNNEEFEVIKKEANEEDEIIICEEKKLDAKLKVKSHNHNMNDKIMIDILLAY